MQEKQQSGLVLIIEDNRNISEMVGEFLESCGFEIDYAADGVDGRRDLQRRAAPRPFEQQVLEEVAGACESLVLVAGTDRHHYTHAHRARRRHRLGEHAHARFDHGSADDAAVRVDREGERLPRCAFAGGGQFDHAAPIRPRRRRVQPPPRPRG